MPERIHCAAELTRLLTERGAQVILGDSPGEPFTPVVLNRVYHTAGLSLCEEAGGVLNRDFDYEEVSFPEGHSVRSFMCCSWLLRCDAVINFSKLKSHGLMGMTAAVKNLYGIIPGTYKSEYHYLHPQPMDFADMLVDLNEYLRPALCLVDAVDVMEGNGPTQGTPRHLGVLLAGRSPYELDRLGARLRPLRPQLPRASHRNPRRPRRHPSEPMRILLLLPGVLSRRGHEGPPPAHRPPGNEIKPEREPRGMVSSDGG